MTTTPSKTKKHRSEQRQRQKVLRCRVLPHERDEIQLVAQELGVSTSELLRSRALKQDIRPRRKPLPSPDRQALARLTGELGRVGSNLNQLARSANNKLEAVDAASLSAAVKECRQLIANLTEVLN